MSDQAGLLLSVRGEARRPVPPDSAVVAATIACPRGAKPEAVRAAAVELDSLTADLAAQGGVALGADSGRRPLTWSAQSVTTHVEHAYDDKTGRHQPTGQVTAAVAVAITVRAFGLLDALGAILAAHEPVSVHDIAWQVDWDNPAWPDVRAAAIQAAIRKARDYATALGGSLRTVEHVADAGLLDGDGGQHRPVASPMARAAAAVGGDSDTPSLDPVPQELVAIIEARFTAGGASLATLAHTDPPAR